MSPIHQPYAPSPARLSPSVLARIARRLASQYPWRRNVRFTDPERWHARVPVGDKGGRPIDAWLLSWLPGQATQLHDHGHAAGSFVVLQGRLTERSTAPSPGGGVSLIERTFDRDRIRAFGADHIHQVLNAEPEPAVSLHVYAPELSVMNQWELSASRLTLVATEREGVDW